MMHSGAQYGRTSDIRVPGAQVRIRASHSNPVRDLADCARAEGVHHLEPKLTDDVAADLKRPRAAGAPRA